MINKPIGYAALLSKSSVKAIEQLEESEWILGDCEPFIVGRDAEIKQDSPVLGSCSKGDQEANRRIRTSEIQCKRLDSEWNTTPSIVAADDTQAPLARVMGKLNT